MKTEFALEYQDRSGTWHRWSMRFLDPHQAAQLAQGLRYRQHFDGPMRLVRIESTEYFSPPFFTQGLRPTPPFLLRYIESLRAKKRG